MLYLFSIPIPKILRSSDHLDCRDYFLFVYVESSREMLVQCKRFVSLFKFFFVFSQLLCCTKKSCTNNRGQRPAKKSGLVKLELNSVLILLSCALSTYLKLREFVPKRFRRKEHEYHDQSST
jgi:hypothetical protein